jgi:hypothetical protein
MRRLERGRRPLVWLLCAVILTAAGCSRLQILYDQADWMLLALFEEWIPVDDTQRDELNTAITRLLVWGCRTQLPTLGALIGDFAADVTAGRTTTERIADDSERIEGLLDLALDQAVPDFAHLLAGLTPEQTATLYRRFEREDRRAERRIRRTRADDSAREYRKLATDQLERWLGPLSPAQERLVAEWARAFEPLGLAGLEYRRGATAGLRALIERHHGDPAALTPALRTFIARLRQDRPPEYARRLADNRARTARMVAELLVASDGTQRAHLAAYATGLTADIAAIRCE